MKKVYETIGGAYVLLMFVFFPLFVSSEGYANITFTKCMTYVVLLSFFAIALGAAYIVAFCRHEGPKIKSITPFSPVYLPDWFLFIMLVAALTSVLFSPYKGELNRFNQNLLIMGAGRFDGLLFVFLYMVVFWLCARYGVFGKWLNTAFTVTLAVMCCIALVQLGGQNALDLYPKSSYKGFHESFISTLGNVDMVSGFLCMAWPLIWIGYIVFEFDTNKDRNKLPQVVKEYMSRDFHLFYFALEKAVRYFYIPVIAVVFYVGLAIDVDSFKLTAAVVIAVMIPLMLRSLKYVRRLMESLGAMIIAFGFNDAVTYTYVESAKRTDTTFTPTSVFFVCISVAVLLFVGSALLKMIKKDNEKVWKFISLGVVSLEVLALIGVFLYFRFIYQPTVTYGLGYDLYELCRGRVSENAGTHRAGIWINAIKMAKENLLFGTGTGTFAISFKEFAKEVGYTFYQNKNLDFAHNEYVDLLCTTGLFGLLSYLGFLFTSAVLAFKSMKRNPKVLILGAAVLSYAVQAFFSFSVVIMTPLFWMLIGLLVKESREAIKYPEKFEPVLELAEDKNAYSNNKKKSKKKKR